MTAARELLLAAPPPGRLVAALTAVIDGQPEFIPTPPGPQRAVRDTDLRNAGIAEGWRQAIAAITDALTPKESDS